MQPDRKLRAKALANEYAPYGPGGSSHTYLDGSSGWLDHDSKGLTFEHYPDHQKVLLRWDRVEKYIDLMIQSDRYLSDKERRAIDFPLELNAASAAEYTALKALHPDTLVGFEAGGNFMFYAFCCKSQTDTMLQPVSQCLLETAVANFLAKGRSFYCTGVHTHTAVSFACTAAGRKRDLGSDFLCKSVEHPPTRSA